MMDWVPKQNMALPRRTVFLAY